MNWKAVWIGWRLDIVRFVALCAVALLLGLTINRVVASARQRVADILPKGLGGLPKDLEGLAGALGGDLLSGPRTTGDTWSYRARLAPGRSVWIRDVNGSVTVEASRGDSLEVSAVKTFRHSDPATVRLAASPRADGIAICALWDVAGQCGPGNEYSEYKDRAARHSDVAVRFTVRVPRGVRIDVTTVNGAVRITGASAPATARTVSGEVSVETSRGPVNALSVDGAVRAALRGFADTGAVKLATVNGAVTLELPARVDATVSASTVNGAIESDFPLELSGALVAHHASGTIGNGGRRIELNSVNGSVRLKKAAPSPH
jgi:hypothetical protein